MPTNPKKPADLSLKKHGTIENYRKEVLEYLSSDNEQ
jgi:hypothetical protein